MKRSILTLAFLPLLLAADGILLKPFVRKGDTWTTNTEFELELSIPETEKKPLEKDKEEKKDEKKDMSSSSLKTNELKLERKEHFDTEILEAKEELASKIRRDYGKSTLKYKTKSDKGETVEKTEDSPFDQMSVVLERDGESVKAVSGASKLSEELKSTLQIELVSSQFLPSQKAEEGKNWNPDTKAFAAFLKQQILGSQSDIQSVTGNLKSSFKGMVDEKGKKVAEIQISGELTAKWTVKEPSAATAEDYPSEISLTGILHFDPATSRPSSFQLNGRIESHTSPITGSLRFTLSIEEASKPTGAAIKLIPRFRAGDVVVITSKDQVQGNLDELKVKVDGKPLDIETPADAGSKESTTVKTREEILEVSEGNIKKLRRQFLDVKAEIKGAENNSNPLEELEGKTIVLEEDGKEIQAKLEGSGKIDKELLKDLDMGDEFRYFLPSDEVKVGSNWTVDNKKLTEMFLKGFSIEELRESEDEINVKDFIAKHVSISVQCKLASLSEEDGVATARITLKIAVDMDISKDDLPKAVKAKMANKEMSVEIHGKFEGELLFDHKNGKPLKLEMSGTVKLQEHHSENAEGDVEIEQSIKTTANLEMSQTFSKENSEK